MSGTAPRRAPASLCDELGATFVAAPGPADLLVNCTSIGLEGGDLLKELGWSADHVENYQVCG